MNAMDTARMIHAISRHIEEFGIAPRGVEVGTDFATVHLVKCHDLRRWAEVARAKVRATSDGMRATRGWLTLKHDPCMACSGRMRRAAA